MRADLGRFADDRKIDISKSETGFGRQLYRVLQKPARTRTRPLRVAGREMRSDVALTDRAKYSVSDCMESNVGIGMTGKAFVVI